MLACYHQGTLETSFCEQDFAFLAGLFLAQDPETLYHEGQAPENID
jgi:hypothetical protein